MKNKLIAILAIVSLSGCATLTKDQAAINAWLANPTNQQNIQTAAKVLATATQLAAPFVTNKSAAADLSAVAFVANSYGTQPVPSNILQATAQAAGIATAVTPLVTRQANSAKTVAIINGAAALLNAATITAAPVSAPTPTSP